MVTEVPPTHWLVDDHYDPDPAAPDRAYTKQGAFLSPTPFDPLAFGIQPNALAATDTSQLLALVAADRLLRSVAPEGLPAAVRERVSVIIGTSALELLTTMGARTQHAVWMRALRAAGVPQEQAEDVCSRIADSYVPWQEATLPGLLSNVVAGRIANRYDLHGSNYTTDAACASSLAAISSGVNELAVGQADLVVVGGVDTLNDPIDVHLLQQDARAVPDRRLPPVLGRCGRDGAGRGHRLVRAASARRRRTRRGHRLRGDPRRRYRLRRPRWRGLRTNVQRAGPRVAASV